MQRSSVCLEALLATDAQSRWRVIAFISALPLLNLLAFTWDAANRTIIEDQWYFLPMVHDYFTGQFHLFSLWVSHSQHRTPGYKLLFLLDAVYFRLDMRLEIMAGLAALAASVLLLMRRFWDSLPSQATPAVALLGLVAITLTTCSLNQWGNLVYSLTALAGYVSTLCFLGLWLALDVRLRQGGGWRATAWLCLGLTFTLLAFAAGMGPAFIVSLLGVPAAVLCREHKPDPAVLRLLGWLTLCAAICELLYWCTGGIHLTSPHAPSFVNLALDHPGQALEFLVLSFSASLIPADAMEKHFHSLGRDLDILVGCGVICLYLGCSYSYIRLKLWTASYLPAFLMAFSVLFILSTLVTRLPTAGVTGAEAPRYVLYSQLGLVGCLWILYLGFANGAPSGGLSRLINPISLCGASALLYLFGLAALWSYHPQAVRNQQIAVQAVLSGDFSTTDWVCLDRVLCEEGRATLAQYRLNVFTSPMAATAQRP